MTCGEAQAAKTPKLYDRSDAAYIFMHVHFPADDLVRCLASSALRVIQGCGLVPVLTQLELSRHLSTSGHCGRFKFAQ